MLDHIILSVSDLERSAAFYRLALAPLGITNYLDFDGEDGHPDLKGFGRDGRAFMWLKAAEPSAAAVHIGFMAESREVVDAAYEAALEAGGQASIPPRIRHEYDSMYYAATFLDPDGYSIEVVIKD